MRVPAIIGDAVITTDVEGRITSLNPIAEVLTGWTQAEAVSRSLESVFKIVDSETRKTVESPTVQALHEGVTVGLTNHTLLITKDGRELPIGPVDHSAIPIRNDHGELTGAVLVFRDITYLFIQERRIRAALAYADNIIETLREPFLVLDNSFRVKSANQAFYETFQVVKNQTEERLIYELGHGQWDTMPLRTLLDQFLLDQDSVHDFAMEADFPTIGTKNMLLNARRFGSVEGHPDLILLAIEDITEKLVAEAKLRDSEERYRRVVELMPAGVYTVDATGVIDFYNQQAAEMWGRRPELGDTDEQFCGSTRLFQNDGTPMPHNQTPVAAALREGSDFRDFKAIIERADGSRIHVRVNIAPICDAGGKIIGAINVFDDISQRNLMELALNESEIRYRRLFETAKDGILILDTESGRITDANPFMSELLGYTHELFLGKELWEIGLFSDRSANEAAVYELQTSGYIRYEHLPLETNTGRLVEVEIVANSYSEGDHSVIQCNIRDITERSRLEADRGRLEIQMREQAVALADLHRRKDEFLAMLSHELRNPLSPIASALQLLGLQKNEDPLQQKARIIIERQVGQLTRLIDDLLEVSRITTGRIHLQKERVALNSIVENAIETVRPLIVRHQHAFMVSLSKEPVWLFADASRLEQVIVNLLTNAAKFTHDSGRIWLTVQQEGNECVLRVGDNGVGIAPETLPHVFDLFTQAERSLDRSQGGLGIGLALVQHIVQMHRGSVEAMSTLGAGTEFVVHLPVMSASESQSNSLEHEDFQKNEHSLRVMVVDDNEDAAQMLGMLLLRLGHEVLTVHDGPSTLTAAQQFLPNVVLLDIGLPGMDGFEVARKMREQSIFKDVVLVAMTGYGQESDRQRSKEAGFNHHLVKPPDFKKLERILEAVSEEKN